MEVWFNANNGYNFGVKVKSGEENDYINKVLTPLVQHKPEIKTFTITNDTFRENITIKTDNLTSINIKF